MLGGGDALDLGFFFCAQPHRVHLLPVRSSPGDVGRVGIGLGMLGLAAELLSQALVEWEYTEAYLEAVDPRPGYNKTRAARYRSDVESADGPIQSDLIDLELPSTSRSIS